MKAIKKPIDVEVWRMGDLAKDPANIPDYQNMPEWVQDEIDESMWIAYIVLGYISADSYLIKEASGALYPCKKEIFEKKYGIIG